MLVRFYWDFEDDEQELTEDISEDSTALDLKLIAYDHAKRDFDANVSYGFEILEDED